MGRARDISKVFSTGTALATDTEVSTTYQTKAAAGLTLLTPTSIVATGGTGSISTNGAVSFTSASAISLNGVFTSTYKNYRLVVNLTTSQTSSQVLQLKMRASSVDTSTGYYNLDIYSSSSSGPSRSYESNAARFSIGNAGNNRTISSVDLFSPQETAVTGLTSLNIEKSTSDFYTSWDGSYLDNSTSYDGFTLSVATGTITGTMSVYGYNQ